MAIEKRSAGPALQRPQPTPRAISARSERPSGETTSLAGRAPAFDLESQTLATPKPGMLANPWVQQYTSPKAESTLQRTETKAVDAGSVKMESGKEPTQKYSSKKKRQGRGRKRS